MTPEERITLATLEAMRKLSLEQLLEERANLRHHIEEALEIAEEMISLAIAEKLKQKALN